MISSVALPDGWTGMLLVQVHPRMMEEIEVVKHDRYGRLRIARKSVRVVGVMIPEMTSATIVLFAPDGRQAEFVGRSWLHPNDRRLRRYTKRGGERRAKRMVLQALAGLDWVPEAVKYGIAAECCGMSAEAMAKIIESNKRRKAEKKARSEAVRAALEMKPGPADQEQAEQDQQEASPAADVDNEIVGKRRRKEEIIQPAEMVS